MKKAATSMLEHGLEMTKSAPTWFFGALAITSAAVLFAPEVMTQALALAEARQLPWVRALSGLTLTFITAAGVVGGCRWFAARVHDLANEYRAIAITKSQLDNLENDEKAILLLYLMEEKRTLCFAPHDITVNALAKARVLVKTGELVASGIPYAIDPWVMQYLRDNPSLVDLDPRAFEQARAYRVEPKRVSYRSIAGRGRRRRHA